jgi:putative acetyltransferase
MNSVIVRAENAADRPHIFDVHAAAFPAPGEARLVDRLRADGDLVLSLVAVVGETIVGHVAFSRMQAPFRALGLAPVGVLPNHQRRGIGAALIEAGLARARGEGWQGVFVLGDPPYYERFGFSLNLASGFSCRYAGAHFMALSLTGDALPQSNGEIAYPASFESVD